MVPGDSRAKVLCEVDMRIVKKFRFIKYAGALLLLTFCHAGRAQAQSDYTAITVENGGTITGTVKWTGPIPKIPKLPVTKNVELCDPNSAKMRDLERLEIDTDGGVANTVVFLKDVTKGKSNGSVGRPRTPRPENLPVCSAHYDRAAGRKIADQEQRS